MQGKTHKLGGVTSAFAGLIFAEKTGIGVGEIHSLASAVVIYPLAIYGSTASDLDHHPGSIPHRDPVSYSISWLMHCLKPLQERTKKNSFAYHLLSLGNAKHRSWQTHSDVSVLVLLLAFYFITTKGIPGFNDVSSAVVQLGLIGLLLGLLAHLFLDMITPEGIHLLSGKFVNLVCRVPIVPGTLRLVPKKPVWVRDKNGKRVSYFATGSIWESHVNTTLKIVNWLLFLYWVYLLTPYQLVIGGVNV